MISKTPTNKRYRDRVFTYLDLAEPLSHSPRAAVRPINIIVADDIDISGARFSPVSAIKIFEKMLE